MLIISKLKYRSIFFIAKVTLSVVLSVQFYAHRPPLMLHIGPLIYQIFLCLFVFFYPKGSQQGSLTGSKCKREEMNQEG